MNLDLDFSDLEPKQTEVFKIGPNNYVLREATEDAAVKFRNAGMRGMRMVDNKVVGMDGVADAAPLLVSLCIFQVLEGNGKDPIYKTVKLETIRSWPTRIVSRLFDIAREMSGLDEDDNEETILKRIEKDNKKLYELRSKRNGQTDPFVGTTTISD